jgi:hypothetical protein
VIEKIIRKTKSPGVRARLYSLVLLVALYLVGRGVISPSDSDFIVAMAALVLGVEGTAETAKRVKAKRA